MYHHQEEGVDNLDVIDDLINDALTSPLGDECCLCDDALRQISIPPQEKWKDFPSNQHPSIVTLDHSKTYQCGILQNRKLCTSGMPS